MHLSVAIVLTVYGIETDIINALLVIKYHDVAIVLTVYGIETFCFNFAD